MRHVGSGLAWVALPIVFTSCQSPDGVVPSGSSATPIVNGARTPSVVALTPAEISAIGWLYDPRDPNESFCTGTLIAPSVVVTAQHCVDGRTQSDVGFGVGQEPRSPEALFEASHVLEHPTSDVALLVLTRSATGADRHPITANRDPIDPSTIGLALNAGGYGDTRDRQRTGRWFAQVFLAEVEAETVTVDGRGQQGICYGDSGGPLLTTGTSSAPVILAVESNGDSTCVDRDVMARLDAVRDWIDPVLEGQLPPDPCNGLSAAGRCNGARLEWCERQQILQVDCGALGTTCALIDPESGYGCACGDLDFLGRCDHNVLEYCDGGYFSRIDCEARGRSCGWVDGETGYNCVRNASCNPEDENGRCLEQTLIRCADGVTTRQRCDLEGMTCQVGAGGAGCFVPDTFPDAGQAPSVDAGAPDSGAGLADAETTADAGAVDAHAEPDAARTEPLIESKDQDAGCGCRATDRPGANHAPGANWLGWLLALSLAGRSLRLRRSSCLPRR